MIVLSSLSEQRASSPSATKGKAPAAKMQKLLDYCRNGEWNKVMKCVASDERVAVSAMKMDNNISTTIIHQAITGDGENEERVHVIQYILDIAPSAAALRNGYKSLPLHTLLQRNSSIKSSFKETLIPLLMKSYPQALLERGGTGERTPLHVIFTNYVSPALTKLVIDLAPEACSILDKKGWLPAHIACSRHCSPVKLDMLLEEYPQALKVKTTKTTEDDREHTLWSLACERSTIAHPNVALRAQLKSHYERHNLWTTEMAAEHDRLPKRKSRPVRVVQRGSKYASRSRSAPSPRCPPPPPITPRPRRSVTRTAQHQDSVDTTTMQVLPRKRKASAELLAEPDNAQGVAAFVHFVRTNKQVKATEMAAV